MSSGYEDEMEATPPKKPKKTIIKRPSNEELQESTNENDEAPKKISVKEMVHEALTDLKSRKGTSLYAIKKYMHENYDVDVAKVNYIIKKLIKSEVEAGILVQVNGIGATGSFKLAPAADKQKTKPKTEKVEKKITKKTEDKKVKMKTTKSDTKTKKSDKTVSDMKKEKKEKKESVKRKLEIIEDKKEKTVRIKTTKQSKSKNVQNTPHKKKTTMSKRKSIGSIIKPPKMKPKA